MADKVRGKDDYTEKEYGEGNYKASREFQKKQHEFARSGEVGGKAREAADALDGSEAEELEKARKKTAHRGENT